MRTESRTSQNPQDFTLKNELSRAVKPFLLYLASIVIAVSTSKDIAKVGFHPSWMAIRLGYMPFMLLALWLTARPWMKRWYELPVWAAAIYVTCFCTYFSLTTGNLSSDYVLGMVQFYFGSAIMPVTALTYFGILAASIGIFVAGNLAFAPGVKMPEPMFISNHVPLLVFAVIVYLITSRIRESKLELQRALASDVKMQEELSRLAAQVAHDIRSPLAALSMVTNQLTALPEDTRVIVRAATGRIQDIANNLLSQYRSSSDSRSPVICAPELIPHLVESIVSEKRVQYRNRSSLEIQSVLNDSAYGVFASVEATQFKAMLSNLIDNAVEASVAEGWVRVGVFGVRDRVQVEVIDNGKGIPAAILPKLMQRGMTFGKANGSGIGLFHARQSVESWNGQMKLESTEGRGTRVQIELPRTEAPAWFVDHIRMGTEARVVILDDDLSIHLLWTRRLPGLTLKHFYSAADLLSWYSELSEVEQKSESLFLFDNELLGESSSGLELIENLRIISSSILVTSRAEDRQLLARCRQLGLRLLPKGMASSVPIELGRDVEPRDCVVRSLH